VFDRNRGVSRDAFKKASYGRNTDYNAFEQYMRSGNISIPLLSTILYCYGFSFFGGDLGN